MRLRYQTPKRRRTARIGAIVYFVLALLATPILLRSPAHQQRWLLIALFIGAVSAVEFLLNSGASTEDALARQNRYFGGVYASISIAVALLLITR